MTGNPIVKSLLAIATALIAVVLAGTWATIAFVHTSFLSLMLVLVALITFFGLLMSPGAVDQSGTVREARIRLAIASTLIVFYLVFFGTTVFFGHGSNMFMGEFAETMLKTLTNMLTIVLPFYFGASIVADYTKRPAKRAKRNDQHTFVLISCSTPSHSCLFHPTPSNLRSPHKSLLKLAKVG